MNVDSIVDGIVIDHIKAGNAMRIYRHLKLKEVKSPIAIIKNCKSQKYGKKDIIKISELIDINLEVLGYIDPDITVNIIKDQKLVEKKHLDLPARLTNVINCKNPRCITSTEQEIDHVFKLTDKQKRIYRCVYCESKSDKEDIG